MKNFDGSGYPNGLEGDQIAIETRIISTCDKFDALMSKRPYKRAWSVDESISEMEKYERIYSRPFTSYCI